MTYPEYEAHIRSRRDYMRIARKDSSGERQVTGQSYCCPSQEEEGERWWAVGEEDVGVVCRV